MNIKIEIKIMKKDNCIVILILKIIIKTNLDIPNQIKIIFIIITEIIDIKDMKEIDQEVVHKEEIDINKTE